MLCPVDDSTLLASGFGGVTSHRCPQCLGAYVPGNLLREVRAHAALELHRQRDDGGRVRPCPGDGTMMKPLHFKGIDLDICPDCHGVWLAAGQVSRLLELVQPARPANLNNVTLNGSPPRKNGFDVGDAVEGIELLSDIADVLFRIWK